MHAKRDSCALNRVHWHIVRATFEPKEFIVVTYGVLLCVLIGPRTWAPCLRMWVFRATSKRHCQPSEQRNCTKCKRDADQVRRRVSTEKKNLAHYLLVATSLMRSYIERHANDPYNAKQIIWIRYIRNGERHRQRRKRTTRSTENVRKKRRTSNTCEKNGNVANFRRFSDVQVLATRASTTVAPIVPFS